jgi:hypothetical protein
MDIKSGFARALFMGSKRAENYVFGTNPGRKAATHIARATKAEQLITALGGTPGPDFVRNTAILSRQKSQAKARGIAAVGATAVIGSRSRRGNSYNPPRTAQGSGRNA